MSAFFQQPDTWVAVAFVLFILLVRKPVGAVLTGGLDGRGKAVRTALDEARELREAAQAELAECKKRNQEAEQTARNILTAATEEAARMKDRAESELARDVERRRQTALDRIARAEQEAVAEIRSTAVDLAMAASRQILQQQLAGDQGAAVMEAAVRDLPQHLNGQSRI